MLFGATLIALVLSADLTPAVGAGNRFLVDGTLEPVQAEVSAVRKEFQLSMMIDNADANSTSLCWTMSERGAGGWSWPDHFGRLKITAMGAVEGESPSLNMEREDGDYLVPVRLPIARFDAPLTLGRQWSEGKSQHEVVDDEPVKERPAWKVVVTGPIGVKSTYWVDKESWRILMLDETVFIGQGEQHRLRYTTTRGDSLDGSQVHAIQSAMEQLTKLRAQLNVEPRSSQKEWSADQLVALRNSLDDVRKFNELEMLRTLVTEVERDAKQQKDRAGALNAMRDRIVGTASPAFEMTDLEGTTFKSSSLPGNVTVLHFWEYRDAPLKEPYGQSAYLDFLVRNHVGAKLKVYGVTVDPRFNDQSTRNRAILSARKFNSFMNISYPVLLDAGDVLKRFGDPRIAGARLPLFVVFDATGKVVHYHVGFYDVVPNRGLEELEKIIQRASGNAQ